MSPKGSWGPSGILSNRPGYWVNGYTEGFLGNTQGNRDLGPESFVNFWVSLGQSGVLGDT